MSTAEKKLLVTAKMQLSTILTYIVKKIIDYSLKKKNKINCNYITKFPCVMQGYPYASGIYNLDFKSHV